MSQISSTFCQVRVAERKDIGQVREKCYIVQLWAISYILLLLLSLHLF